MNKPAFAIAAISTLALLLAPAACGDSQENTGGGDQGPAGPGATGTEATGPGSGGDGTGGKAPSDYLGYGVVGVYSYDYAAAGTAVKVSGAYASYALNAGTASPCTVTNQGSCVIYDCPGNTNPAQPTPQSAGTIAITGGQRTISLTPNGNDYATESSATQTLFAGGETLSFDVSGSGEIAMHQRTLIAPSRVTVNGISPATPTSINRTMPFGLSWSGGADGEVSVAIGATELNGNQVVRSVSAQCRFPAGAGTGSVPASALGLLPASSPSVTASLSVSSLATTSQGVGDFFVTFTASALAVTTSGEAASSLATLN